LQEDTAIRTLDENVHRTVKQAFGMHNPTGRLSDHLVIAVDYIE
jgi:hypothetical protein